MEYTKAGIPHLHVAVNQYVPRSWLQSKWQKLTGAWNVDLRELRDVQDATKYLAKYLGKTLQIVGADDVSATPRLRGVHIYGSSLDMPITPPKVETTWELVRNPEDVGALLALPKGHRASDEVAVKPAQGRETARGAQGAPETEGSGGNPPKDRRETGSPLKHAEGPGPPGRGKVAYRGRCRSCGLRIFAPDPWTVADLMAEHAREAH